jgi:hypothetical protein
MLNYDTNSFQKNIIECTIEHMELCSRIAESDQEIKNRINSEVCLQLESFFCHYSSEDVILNFEFMRLLSNSTELITYLHFCPKIIVVIGVSSFYQCCHSYFMEPGNFSSFLNTIIEKIKEKNQKMALTDRITILRKRAWFFSSFSLMFTLGFGCLFSIDIKSEMRAFFLRIAIDEGKKQMTNLLKNILSENPIID